MTTPEPSRDSDASGDSESTGNPDSRTDPNSTGKPDADETPTTDTGAVGNGGQEATRTDGPEAAESDPITSVAGGLGFLTRLPVGSERAWTAFRRSPWAFPVVGYPIGALVALVAAAPLPRASAAVLATVALYGLTGVLHLDGVADLGDAAVVHGDSDDRRAVLKDTTVGVGAVAAIGVTLVALTFGLFGVAGPPARTAVAVVIAAEVGAKLGMAIAASVGRAPHEGLGSAFTERSEPRDVGVAVLTTLPLLTVALILGLGVVTSGALLGGVAVAVLVRRRAASLVGGTNGDVFGAVNEIGRVAGLHAGVILWTVS